MNRLDGLKQALLQDPDNHAVRLMLAELLKTSGYPAEALEHYKLLLEKGVMLEESLVEAGLLAADAGEFEMAQNCLEIAQHLGIESAKLEEKLEKYRIKVPVSPSPDYIHATLDGEPEPALTFKGVGGLEDVKKLITRLIILPFQRPEIYQKYGKRAGGGILFYGPPGCGKTMLARATAGECGLAFHNVRIEDVLSPYIGMSETNLHNLFNRARQQAPCVLFIDEIDTIGFARRKQSSNHGRGLIDQLLQELDAIGSDNTGLLIMAATNAPWDLDDAMLRPGRFDRRILVPPPDEIARRSILRLHLADRFAEAINDQKLAKATSLFSGADLQALVEQAVERVIDEALTSDTEPPLTMRHLEETLAELHPSTLEWLRQARNYVEFANQDRKYDEVAKFLRTKEARLLS